MTRKLIVLWTLNRQAKILLRIVNNIVHFSPHSCRAASSSKSKRTYVNINEIIRRGYWKNRKNFSKYYDNEITEYAPDDVDINRICRVNNIIWFLGWRINVLYWFPYVKLLISNALKSYFFTWNWQSENEYKH